MTRYCFLFGLLAIVAASAAARAETPPIRKASDPPVIETGWDDLLDGVETLDDWREKRKILRKRFLELIGDDAKPIKPPLNLKVHKTATVDGIYVRKLISYQVEPDQRAWAYLAIPIKLDGPAPAVVALHGTAVEGKDVTAGFVDRPGHRGAGHLDYLARRGYVVIGPDHFNMGRRLPPDGRYHTDLLYKRHPGWSAPGKIVFDGAIAVDVLQSLDEVDPKRIAALGHSLGGMASFYLAAYDERIRVAACVDGSFTFRFNTSLTDWARPSGQFSYFNNLRPALEKGNLPPIDIHEVIALIAPRAFLDCVSVNDKYGGSALSHRQRVLMNLRLADVWQLEGAAENFAFYIRGQGHSFQHDTRELVYAWIDKHLQTDRAATPKPLEKDLGTGPFLDRKTLLASRLQAENMDLSPSAGQGGAGQGGQSHFRGGNGQWLYNVASRRENRDSPRERLLTSDVPGETGYHLGLTVTSELPSGNVPMDPTIDFGRIIREAKLPGVLDPNSIRVINKTTGKSVPFALTEDFAYGDRGRLEWVIGDPGNKTFEICFRTAVKRPPLAPAKYTPLIGTGDLLRYNAGEPRPFALPYPARLVDLTGDGKRDLVGCWNYAYRPGWPWDGIICYPRVGDPDRFEFGDLVRVRHVAKADSTDFKHTDFKHFVRIYMQTDFADFNGDGLIDLVYSPSGGNELFLYLNSGRRDEGGMPVFVAGGSVPRQTGKWQPWEPCRAVDLDRDGAVDFVVGDTWSRNKNPKGWPIELAEGVTMDAGRGACFLDLNRDGRLDAVCLEDVPGEGLYNYRVAWRRNLGGDVPRFAPAEPLTDIDIKFPGVVAAVRTCFENTTVDHPKGATGCLPASVLGHFSTALADKQPVAPFSKHVLSDGPRRGLLVGHRHCQNLSFFQQIDASDGKPRFKRFGRAESVSAVPALSDQAWPCPCDWDGDGDLDLLVGGGFGLPRILINEGSNRRIALSEPQHILSEGKPIRVTRDEILGGKHEHNMGYPYPVYVDWDGDGLPDLMLPNETNRIFWYKNIGARRNPKFGPRRQILCDGYPDSPQHRAESARLAGDKDIPNHPYPYQKDRPFFWRTAAAFADWNGDGLTDLVTHDGFTRKATLFVQYCDDEGKRRLKKQQPLELSDGRLIDDWIVNRNKHWTEGFRATDWDGDGLIDLIYSCAGAHGGIQDGGSIYLLRNCGTESDPVFEPPVTMRCFGEPIRITNHGPHPWPADLDGDGKPDLLACVEWSVYPFYGHNALEMDARPRFTLSPVEAEKQLSVFITPPRGLPPWSDD